jgi:hypothetical protein
VAGVGVDQDLGSLGSQPDPLPGAEFERRHRGGGDVGEGGWVAVDGDADPVGEQFQVGDGPAPDVAG